jgi:hypothetical protein
MYFYVNYRLILWRTAESAIFKKVVEKVTFLEPNAVFKNEKDAEKSRLSFPILLKKEVEKKPLIFV